MKPRLNLLAASIVWAASALLFQGCAISMNLAANRFESPETRGKLLKAQIDAVGIQGANTVVIVRDVQASPLQVNNPSFERTNFGYRAGLGLGIFKDLDLSIKLARDTPTLFQVKYQILGQPEIEAQKGNLALAITAGIGNLQGSGSASPNGLSSISAKYDLNATAYDLALIAGYRFHEVLLAYGGPFVTSTSYSGHVDQTTTSVNSYAFSGSAGQTGFNLGLQVDSTVVYFKLEEAWATAHAGSTTQSGFFTGAMLGFRF